MKEFRPNSKDIIKLLLDLNSSLGKIDRPEFDPEQESISLPIMGKALAFFKETNDLFDYCEPLFDDNLIGPINKIRFEINEDYNTIEKLVMDEGQKKDIEIRNKILMELADKHCIPMLTLNEMIKQSIKTQIKRFKNQNNSASLFLGIH